MIFHEIHSAYYRAVLEILRFAVRGELNEEKMKEIVSSVAFSESTLAIIPNLKSGKWQLLLPDLTSPLQNEPTIPLSLTEKRWLKAVLCDPRVRLFDCGIAGLEDVDPLFTPEDYVVYDRFGDGDPYFDEGYVTRFRAILASVREKHPMQIELVNRKGQVVRLHVLPRRLEYSEKDDKFRLVCSGSRSTTVINLARIISCRRYNGKLSPIKEIRKEKCSVTLKITDERNTLERCMLHFSHFEKQAERIAENEYRVSIFYDRNDETEMVIRVLGFGPTIEVIEPPAFRKLIIQRLIKQKS